ncbi:hypothetical protein CROQUDRAFT_52774 [Cronartium quercuum f. sp. fusiforme G11]|uniref:Uncharacterized protein n=1 Tax=Cronartium quercuum f. sp. fusiforme G11 TaxID=708437 RepID=A0A9P6N6Y0_9BASI|nr:hypothetical protein CROQUDRAFT_52774 [Cronartium quercuum f. sp. fusiforme G11]
MSILFSSISRRAILAQPSSDLQLFRTTGVCDQRRGKASTKQTKSSKPVKASENRSAQSKGYLKKSGAGRPVATSSGSDRTETIRKMLYEQAEDPDRRIERLEAVVPSPDVHETIHRAWQLRLRRKRENMESRLEAQYISMDRALEALRTTDVSLYLRTLKDSDGNMARLENVGARTLGTLNATGKLPGLFPRQMRIPTETEPVNGKVWEHEWKNPIDPLLKPVLV